MNKVCKNIIIFALAAALLPAAAWAQAAKKSDKDLVTKARQLQLKLKLMEAGDSQLMAARLSNGLEWDKLTPDQREKIREEVLAFMSKSEVEQEKLLKHYQRLIRLDNDQREAYLRRAAWLRVVVESFTPQEREAMEALSPQERAAKLLERKETLIRQGKLPQDGPASQSPTATTQP